MTSAKQARGAHSDREPIPDYGARWATIRMRGVRAYLLYCEITVA